MYVRMYAHTYVCVIYTFVLLYVCGGVKGGGQKAAVPLPLYTRSDAEIRSATVSGERKRNGKEKKRKTIIVNEI